MSVDSSVFHSEDLRAAIDASSEFIEKHAEVRDRVSDDIKSLELYLEEHAPKEPFRVSYGKGFVAVDNSQLIQASLELTGCAGGEIQEDVLVWKPDPKGRYRLHYELCRWDGEIDVDMPGGPLFHDSSTLKCESRPLIETPFEVRKSMAPRLPAFVRLLAQHLSPAATTSNEPAKDDDISF